MDPSLPHRRRGLTAINGAMALVVVLVITQVWLLSATLDSFLAGRRSAALPGAIFSGLLFLGCGALYLFILRIERQARKDEREKP